ncbi:DUF5783 family protein [Natrialbaceae archaeon GCM10025810]|uniref:DUF5783 family protein n=1 Tax=Halovalidus salilacus TaxID=3075124 RepID=UPI0036067157
MTAFDPEKFDDTYVHYFDELQAAYSRAFQHLHGRYDSRVLRAIDHHVLGESEPVYLGGGEFRIELPDDPRERVENVPFDDEEFEAVLEAFVDRIELELRRIFEFEDGA